MRTALLALALFAAPLALPAQGASAAPTIVIIVRHGEKAPEPASDPLLSAVGTQRAAALADALKEATVDVVMHTPTTRTRETARPTAERFGLTPEILPLGPMAQHPAQVAAAVRKHAGKTVLVVGHSNTIMRYIAALGGPTRPDLCDDKYDGLYTLIITGDKVQLVEGRYGPANPPATAPCEQM